MSGTSTAPHLSLFCSQITDRRFDDETVLILESVLVSKDLRSLIETRSSLKQFLRSESLAVIHEIKDKPVEQKLLILQFFVRAFALIADIESCLALKYEALLLREVKSTSHHWLQVSYTEWLNFAKHSLDNGFFSIAREASEKALSCLQKNNVSSAETGEVSENGEAIEKIKRLKDQAVNHLASGSVQAQAAGYLKRKTVDKNKISSSFCEETKCAASTLFRNGIKKRHVRELRKRQTLQQNIGLQVRRLSDTCSRNSFLVT